MRLVQLNVAYSWHEARLAWKSRVVNRAGRFVEIYSTGDGDVYVRRSEKAKGRLVEFWTGKRLLEDHLDVGYGVAEGSLSVFPSLDVQWRDTSEDIFAEMWELQDTSGEGFNLLDRSGVVLMVLTLSGAEEALKSNPEMVRRSLRCSLCNPSLAKVKAQMAEYFRGAV